VQATETAEEEIPPFDESSDSSYESYDKIDLPPPKPQKGGMGLGLNLAALK
jgi:hypothetical protein